MKLINNIQKYKNKMRIWVLLAWMLGLGACAYDPAMEEKSNNKPEIAEKEQEENTIDDPEDESVDEDEVDDRVDLLVSERLLLKSFPEKIRRLTFLENSVLETDGANLKLDVEEIVSFGGSIDTTPKTKPSGFGNKGNDGGLLFIHAQRGRGDLKIIAGGQNGSIGAKGARGKSGSKGARGHDGKNDYQTECLLSVLTILDREFPGRCFKNWYCSRETGDGAIGGRGATGKTGLRGGAGGDSSPIFVKLEDPSDIVISTEVRFGKGGIGGSGGDGGLGGQGGDPGSRDSRKLCRSANRGPQGPRGKQGPSGPNGTDGKEQPICLRLGAAQIGDCRDFNNLTQ